MRDDEKVLKLTFHGRIIDHLGIQMYQSPVAAVAELISNAWDADAETVDIFLPDDLEDDAEIRVQDDGIGMTYKECQDCFLNVGWCRRGSNPIEQTKEKLRPVLGRKGIGKFAGFGIASIIRIETVSKGTGEKTIFELDINDLRSDIYIQTDGGEIKVVEYLPPDPSRKDNHGTSVILKNLKIGRRPSAESFSRSMARRFLLHQRSQDFKVMVNGNQLPDEEDLEGLEYIFPRDFKQGEKPQNLQEDGEWGVETLTNQRIIRWRIAFYRNTIEEEELRGISVFSRGKLAQKPFFFNLSGGLGGQHGQEYIATERQRINWDHDETAPLEDWGQNRIKSLLRIWRDRRGEERRRQIEDKVAAFSHRMDKLPSYEQRIVKRALTSIGGIPTLSENQFQSLGESILQAWEQGRLHDLIDDLANSQDVTSEWLLSALAEADVLVALNLAEAVRTKIEALKGLKVLVERRELENAVRDYIAEKPYLLHPRWETFRKETSVRRFMDEAAIEAGLVENDETNDGERKRIDLALRSNEHLLIIEFMRPGKRADWDHLSRCRRYVLLIRDKIEPETALGISKVTGLIVADRLDSDASVRREIKELEKSDILAFSWSSLLEQSERTWREFLEILGARAPEDQRLKKLQES
jgi:hypothetical protein